MGKLVFWVVVILGALVVARILARQAARRQQGGAQPKTRGATGRGRAAPPGPAESMVRCAHCGIHLPRSEALLLGGETWCSQEHARLGRPS